MSPRVAMMMRDKRDRLGASFNLRAMLAALALTLRWIVLVRRRSLEPPRRLNWAPE